MVPPNLAPEVKCLPEPEWAGWNGYRACPLSIRCPSKLLPKRAAASAASFIKVSKSSGGLQPSSMLPNVAYASVLLPRARKVDLSLTQASKMTLVLLLNRKNNRYCW